MSEYTLSTMLVMEKSLRQRVTELNQLRGELTKRVTWMDPNRIEEPTYDIKIVDRKIVDLEKALFKISQKVKEVNASTKVTIDVDFDKLMEPLQ